MPLDTEAIVAIQQLYAAYCHTLDDGDGDAFSACFTTDGTLGGAGATTELLASGRYRDRLRRAEGKWRFAERVFIPDV